MFFDFFKKKSSDRDLTINDGFELDKDRIPAHIAIIMDGNGRWAKSKNLPRAMGHKAGVETVRKILIEARTLGVKYLTLYAFSTENWKRPKEEVDGLMRLFVKSINNEVDELDKNGVVLNFLGDLSKLPDDVKASIDAAVARTKFNKIITLNIAINYGGRDEIRRAVKEIALESVKGIISPEEIDEEMISNHLDTGGMPDPDIIIRPSGEQRISNFLLWQCAYSEFWIANINWPDFSERHFRKAIYDYQQRSRRFGGL